MKNCKEAPHKGIRARYTAVYDVLIYSWSVENTDIFTGQFIIWHRILLIMIAMVLCGPLDIKLTKRTSMALHVMFLLFFSCPSDHLGLSSD